MGDRGHVTHATGLLTGAGGRRIFWQSWNPGGEPRAVVVIVHGASEHSDRYVHVAEALRARRLRGLRARPSRSRPFRGSASADRPARQCRRRSRPARRPGVGRAPHRRPCTCSATAWAGRSRCATRCSTGTLAGLILSGPAGGARRGARPAARHRQCPIDGRAENAADRDRPVAGQPRPGGRQRLRRRIRSSTTASCRPGRRPNWRRRSTRSRTPSARSTCRR